MFGRGPKKMAHPRGGEMRLFKILLCSCVLNMACLVNTVPVPRPVSPPVVVAQPWLLQVTVRGSNGDALPDAVGSLKFDLAPCTAPIAAAQNIGGRLVFNVPAACSDTWGGYLTSGADGYQLTTVRLVQPDENQSDLSLIPNLPPVPSRAQVINIKLTFQGLTVCTAQLGCIPWFEPFIMALTNPADRQAVYAAKHAQGDTHLILECFSSSRPVYDEVPFTGIIAPNCDADPQTFLSLVEEVIQNGFTPIITYDGDNGDNTPFGSANAARQAPILAGLLQGSAYGDLNSYVLYFRGWDSVFYGSSPANITAFGQTFRAILPNGYLGLEFNIGHIPLGNGPADYASGGAMSDYDVIMSEFDNWPMVGEAEYEILVRMLGPSYIQDPTHSTAGPWYLQSGSPRGPYAFSCFEWGEYQWTHGQMTPAEYLQGYAWYKARGCPEM